jgi:hypothetical protein
MIWELNKFLKMMQLLENFYDQIKINYEKFIYFIIFWSK